MIEVRCVYEDDSQESRTWTWRDVNDGQKAPIPDPQPWMLDPRKSWQHPQDPIIYSFLVKPGHEKEASAWLASL